MGTLTVYGAGETVEITLDGTTWKPATIFKALPKRLYQVHLGEGGYVYVGEDRIRRPAVADPGVDR